MPSLIFHFLFKVHKYTKLCVAISGMSRNTLISKDYSNEHKAAHSTTAHSACFQWKEEWQEQWSFAVLLGKHWNPSPVDDYLLENITKCHIRPQKGQYLSKHCYRHPKANQSPGSCLPVCVLKKYENSAKCVLTHPCQINCYVQSSWRNSCYTAVWWRSVKRLDQNLSINA